MIVKSVPTCRLDAVGSNPMYAVTRSFANASASPSVASDTRPRHCSSSHRVVITVVYEAHSPCRPQTAVRRCAARRPGLVFGLCWAVNTRLNECLRARDTRFRQVTIGPHRVWLDVTDQSGFDAYFYGHLYEPILTATLLQHLHDGDVFVDIGANAGLFSMLAAKLVGPSGRVIAFEPHPGARAEMMRLLDRNAVADRVDVVSAALSDRDGHTASLHITSRSGLSTLDP